MIVHLLASPAVLLPGIYKASSLDYFPSLHSACAHPQAQSQAFFERQLCEFYKLAPIKPLRQKAKSTFLALWNFSALISSSVHYSTFRWCEKQRENFKQMSNYNVQKRNRSEFPD